MNNMETLRQEINKIDAKLLDLFLGRMEICKKIGEYKKANNLPVYDKDREAEILKSKTKDAPFALKESVADFFANIMKISRILQAEESCMATSLPFGLSDFSTLGLKKDPLVAYQGIPGANSETALTMFFGENCRKVNTMTFDEVLDAVENEDADYGILPVENSSTGSISSSYDLLYRRNLFIVGEVDVAIKHSLVGLKSAELRDIRTVYSHEQGYMQCKNFIDSFPKMEFEPYHNTALAAKMISGLGDVSKAAIASPKTAQLYGLKILAEDISSFGDNVTRFKVVAKRGHLSKEYKKISLLFTLPNKSGSLNSILSAFTSKNINLVKIESRPSHDENFEYMFFVDFEGNLLDPSVQDALSQIRECTSSFKILGNYNSF